MSHKQDFGFNKFDFSNGPEKKADTFLQHGPREEHAAYQRGRIARRKEPARMIRVGHKLVPYRVEVDE